jgi:hypothetical protein
MRQIVEINRINSEGGGELVTMLPQGSEIKSFNLMQWNGKGV